MYWHNFIEVTGFVPATANSRFQAGSALAGQFRELLDPRPLPWFLMQPIPYLPIYFI